MLMVIACASAWQANSSDLPSSIWWTIDLRASTASSKRAGTNAFALANARGCALPSRLQVPFNLCHKAGELLRLIPKDVELGLRVGGL